MKKLALLFLICLPVVGFSRVNFVVKGKTKTINYPSKIFMFYRDGVKSKADSVIVKDHAFEFRGIVADTVTATLIVDYKGKGLDDFWKKSNPDEINVYLVNGSTTVVANDSLYGAKVSGNKLNESYARYNTMMRPLMKKWASAKTNEDYSAVETEKPILNQKFLDANPDSYVSLDQAMPNIAAGYANPDTIEPIFHTLSKGVRSTKAGVIYQQYIDNLRKATIGMMAPEIAQPDTNGRVIKLSSLKGRYVLIDFWASWCAPCRAEDPNVVKAFNKYKGKNFTILGVSLDKPGAKDAWLNAIHKDGLWWYQVADLQGWKNSVAIDYGIQVIPQNFLIDPNGKIIAKNLFEDDLDKKLEEVLGKM